MFSPDGLFDSVQSRLDSEFSRHVYPQRHQGVDDPALDLIERP